MQDKKNWKEEKICVSKNVWLQKKNCNKKDMSWSNIYNI